MKDQFTRLVLYPQQTVSKAKMRHFIFQRDKNTEDGEEVYLYYNQDYGYWYLTEGSDFHAKNSIAWMYLSSSGKK